MKTRNVDPTLLKKLLREAGLLPRHARTLDPIDDASHYRIEFDWRPYFDPQKLSQYLQDELEIKLNARVTAAIQFQLPGKPERAFLFCIVTLLNKSDENAFSEVSLDWLSLPFSDVEAVA